MPIEILGEIVYNNTCQGEGKDLSDGVLGSN